MLGSLRSRAQVFVAAASLIAFVAAAVATVGSSTAAAPAPTVGGCDVFPASTAGAKAKSAGDLTAWNQNVTRAPVAKNSSRVINPLSHEKLHPDFGSNTDYGIPYDVVPMSQPNTNVKIGPRGYPDESDFGPAPIPDGAAIEGGPNNDGDSHVLVVQQGSCQLFEMWHSKFSGGQWQADATARFNLGNPSVSQRGEGFTSADAAGLPILPGLVRYDEVTAGAVNHAIRLTFDESRAAYLHPANHFASSECSPKLPPMGLRLRMKRSYFRANQSKYPEGSQSRVIFVALFHYGFIVADNGSDWYFQGGSDSRWNDNDLNKLKRIPGSAFQVVKSASRLIKSSAC